jgi:hypothetical protein
MRTNPHSTQKDDKGIGKSALREGLCRLASGMRSVLRGWSEVMRTAACLLTCLGLAVSSSCSTAPSAESDVAQASTGSDRATLLKKLLPRGTDAEITEMNGRVHKIHVTRTHQETITGTTPDGRVSIPMADVRMARVPKNPPKSFRKSDDGPKYKQWGPGDGHISALEFGGGVVFVTGCAVGGFLYGLGTLPPLL